MIRSFLLAALVTAVLCPAAWALSSHRGALVGQWRAPGVLLQLGEDGAGKVETGNCTLGLRWHARRQRLTLRFASDPVCLNLTDEAAESSVKVGGSYRLTTPYSFDDSEALRLAFKPWQLSTPKNEPR